MHASRELGVLLPRLDVSVWNLRRSLQAGCLLVPYRPLACWFLTTPNRLRVPYVTLLSSPHSCYFESQREDSIEEVPERYRHTCTLLPPSTPSPRQQAAVKHHGCYVGQRGNIHHPVAPARPTPRPLSPAMEANKVK